MKITRDVADALPHAHEQGPVSCRRPALGVEIRLLGPEDAEVLQKVDPGVFDNPVDPRWTARFLSDSRHHLIVAIDAGCVVGMITAVDYAHPDKAPQLFINEIGVAESHRRRGIARQLLEAMLAHGRTIECTEAWVGTEGDNVPARTLYESAGAVSEDFVLYSFDFTRAP